MMHDNPRKWRASRITAGIIVLEILLLSGSVGAVPAEEWNRTLGENGASTIPYSLLQTSDGGYIAAGVIQKGEFVVGTGWLNKIDAKGNLQWNRTFGGKNYDEIRSVQQTSDGGYILAGHTSVYRDGNYDSDFWLIKTDAKGDQQWNRTFGGKSFEFAYLVRQTRDGYIIAGEKHKNDGRNADVWLIKTDEKGSEKWNKIFDGPGSNRPVYIGQTLDGGFMLGVEQSFWTGGTGSRAWFIKTDTMANEQWDKTFEGKGIAWATSIQQTRDGYIIAGQREYGTRTDVWMTKINENGSEQWNRMLGMDSFNYAVSVQQTKDGGYVIAGEKQTTDIDVQLIKTDAEGNVQWNRTFGEGRTSQVLQTLDGGYIIAGYRSYNNQDPWSKGYARLIKVGGEEAETEITPVETQTETPAISPTRPMAIVPNEIPKASSTKKSEGFEIVLAIAILLLAHRARVRR